MQKIRVARKSAPTSPPLPQTRADRLTLNAAERVIRKEAAALRKAFQRAQASPDPLGSWARAVASLYEDEHVEYLSSNLLVSKPTAAAWCRYQTNVLLSLKQWDVIAIELEHFESDVPPILSALANIEAYSGRLPAFLERVGRQSAS